VTINRDRHHDLHERRTSESTPLLFIVSLSVAFSEKRGFSDSDSTDGKQQSVIELTAFRERSPDVFRPQFQEQ